MLPSAPTDNIFKLLAVGGLLLAGFSVWTIKDTQDKLNVSEAAARGQYVEFVSEFEARLNEMASKIPTKEPLKVALTVPGHDGKHVRLQAGAEYRLPLDKEGREWHRACIKHFDTFLASALPHNGQKPNEATGVLTEKVTREMRAKLQQHSLAAESLWLQADAAERDSNLASVGIVAGAMCSFFGFFFWVRAHRRQEASERVKDEKERHELATLKAERGAAGETPPPDTSAPRPPEDQGK